MISERRDLEYNLPLSSSSSCVSVSSTSTTGTSTTTLLRRVNSSGYLNKNINTQQKDNIDQLYYNSNHDQEPEEDYDLEGGLDRGHEVTEDDDEEEDLLYYDKRPTYYSYFDVEDNNNNNNNNRRYCCDLTRGARKSELFLISVKIAQIYMYFSLVAVAFLLFIAFLFHKQPFFITGLCSTSYLDVTNQNTNTNSQEQSGMSDKVQFALSNAVKGAFAYFITYLFCLYYIHRGEHMIIQLQRYLREFQQQKRQTTSNNNNNNNNTRWSLLFLLPWRFIEKWRWRYSRGYNTTFIRTGSNTYYNNDEEKELCPIVYNSYVNDKDRTSPFRRKGTNSATAAAAAAGGGVMMRNTPSSTSTKKRKKGKKSGSRINSHTNNNHTDTILPLSSSHSDVGAKKYAYGTFQFWKQANTSSDIKGNYKDKHR